MSIIRWKKTSFSSFDEKRRYESESRNYGKNWSHFFERKREYGTFGQRLWNIVEDIWTVFVLGSIILFVLIFIAEGLASKLFGINLFYG